MKFLKNCASMRGLSSKERPRDMAIDEKPGEEERSFKEVDMAEREKGELKPKDLEREVDMAG